MRGGIAKAVGLAALCVAVGCELGVGGERSKGGCPSGETCSPSTPDGLSFSDFRSIAVGGRHAISIQDLPGGVRFDVVSSDPTVLQVAERDGTRVVLEGVSPGTVYLRVVDRGRMREGLLLDRLELRVAEAVSVVARPDSPAVVSPFLGPMALDVDLGSVVLAPRLLAADGTELAADDAEMLSPAPDEEVPLVVGQPVTWEVRALGALHDGAIPVVDTVDALRVVDVRYSDLEGLFSDEVLDQGECLVPFFEDRAVFGATVGVHATSRTGSSNAGYWYECPWEQGRSRWDVTAGPVERSYWVDLRGDEASFTPVTSSP